MKCEDVELRLDPFRTRELPPDECEEITTHLGGCRSCEDDLEAVEAIAGNARSLLGECSTTAGRRVLEEMTLRYDAIEHEGRRYWIAFTPRGIRRIGRQSEESAFVEEIEGHGDMIACRAVLPDAWRQSLIDALRGEEAEAEVDLAGLPPFEQQVLEVLRSIPKGEVRTYAWVAREAGRPSAIRAVGNSCAKNPVPFLIPCHRVVPTGGGVGNYAYGAPMKRALLEKEGVPVDVLDELARRRVRYLGSTKGRFYCFPTCGDALELPDGDRVELHDDDEALAMGLEPCDVCRPLALSA